MALLSAPLVVSAEDMGAKTKQSDTSKTSGTTTTTGTAKTGTTDAKTTTDAKPAKLTPEELQVMAHYHAVNLMEIDINKVAAKKATSEGAKAYAKMLVKDHTDADKALFALAKKTKQRIPAEKPASDVEKQEKAEDKKLVAKLKTMKGPDFERQYLQFMVTGHEKELAKIDANVARVQNAELADSLRAMKPVLQHHADEARALQSNAGGVSSTGTGTGTTGTATGTATTGTQARSGTGTSTTGTAKIGASGTPRTGAGTTTSGTGTAKTGAAGTSTGSTNPVNTPTNSNSGAQKAPPPPHKH